MTPHVWLKSDLMYNKKDSVVVNYSFTLTDWRLEKGKNAQEYVIFYEFNFFFEDLSRAIFFVNLFNVNNLMIIFEFLCI